MTYELKPAPKPSGGRGKSRRVSPGLKNRTPMKKFNAKRGGHAFPKNVDEARREFIRAQACAVTGALTGEWIVRSDWMPKTLPTMWRCLVVVAHVQSRGSGGVAPAGKDAS